MISIPPLQPQSKNSVNLVFSITLPSTTMTSKNNNKTKTNNNNRSNNLRTILKYQKIKNLTVVMIMVTTICSNLSERGM